MKKQSKKLVLAKETLRGLDLGGRKGILGGTEFPPETEVLACNFVSQGTCPYATCQTHECPTQYPQCN